MKARIIAAVCSAAVALGCGLSQSVSADGEMVSYEPTTENVKTLGRTYYNGESLWFSLTASGAEYQFTGTTTAITITGDGNAISATEGARIGFFADGKKVDDVMLTENPQKVTLDLGEDKLHTVSVVKLSESANSSVLIDEIEADGAISPTESKSHSIEFIGDSITCGYGVDGKSENDHFLTSTEDGTKTYAYKTAQLFDSDYSMVSYSGYGVLSGYTSNDKINSNSIVSKYYDKVGFSWGWIDGKNISQVDWDFSSSPELVVVNLGTNDDSYTKGKADRIEAFTAEYVDLIKLIREKNPNSEILCTLGIMGQDLYPAIEDAVKQYVDETGDTKINSLKFDVQNLEDGLGSDWHPSEKTHAKAAHKLADKITELYGWSVNDVDIDPIDSSSEEDTSSEDNSDASSDENSETENSSSEATTDTSSAADSSANSSATSSASSSAASSSSASGNKDASPQTGVTAVASAVAIFFAVSAIVSKKKK